MRNTVRISGIQKKHTEAIAGYVFIIPAIILLSVFCIYPMLYAFFVSLHKWDGLNQMVYVGFDNFSRLIGDHDWLSALGRTFIYTAIYAPALFFCSLILALLVKSIPAINGAFRTILFLPVVLSSVVTGLIWKLMYDEKGGLINSVLGIVGINPVSWLSSPSTAMISIIITGIWMSMGYYMIIFLAGLQDIPKEWYEAAKIDGANSLKSFWNITLPSLKNTCAFVIIVTIIGSFQAFDQIKLMTNGGPASSTKLGIQYIYETSFQLYQMGDAAAMSFFLFFIILIFTLIQLKLLSNQKD